MNDKTQLYITATQTWLTSVIIAHNICPFAKREQERGSIRFSVDQDIDIETCLMTFMQECERLDTDTDIETTLLIYATAFKLFDDFLDFLEIAETLLYEQGYEGVYQLASFHPDYCFEGAKLDDPANYTNRSPYPMLHLLRETSIDRAVSNYPDVENIPQRNIELMRTLGMTKLQSLLAACYSSSTYS
ncbi:hypothetical protein BCS42_01105 [Crenothrix sp. D3]|nr:hypothetical protein BCS42_01105 [Crenothrix sp. D3]